ncbi:hypothetical protein J6590_068880 [Homalodisca vitripennis]|nr:hypothetical protein J6590_068880 [Homalodisca vitripennis]
MESKCPYYDRGNPHYGLEQKQSLTPGRRHLSTPESGLMESLLVSQICLRAAQRQSRVLSAQIV